MTSPEPKPKVRITVTISQEVLDNIDSLAKREHRSRSQMVEVIILEKLAD